MDGTPPLRSGGSLYVHALLHASELVPPAGPVGGGTRVTVLGAGFRDVATLRCRFEVSDGSGGGGGNGVGSTSTAVARRAHAHRRI